MNYTAREVDEIQARRDAYAREGMLIGFAVVALSAGAVGAIFGWLARGWLQ